MNQVKQSAINGVTSQPTTVQAGTNIAASIYELASRFQTPLTPENFKTWYIYVIGGNPALVERVNKLTQSQSSFNPSEFKQLYSECIDIDLGPHEHSAVIHTELNAIMDAVNSYMSSSDEYSDNLKEVDEQISETNIPPDFKNIVTTLLKENLKIREQAATAYASLEKSQQSIEQIRIELQETQDEALKDPLTKIGNRRCFDAQLSIAVMNAEKSGKSLCLAIADLDKFKLLNDNYGHLVGDAVLKYFASLMDEIAEEPQIATRFGGEEFAIIFPETKLEEATALVEELRGKLEVSNLVTINNRRPIGTVTASFGISKFVKGDTSETMVQRADKLLYQAKDGGRNRICI